MLHQISWFTYGVSIISLIIIYYLYVGITYYRTELLAMIYRLTGKQPDAKVARYGDLQIRDYDIMGKAEPEGVAFVAPEELSFGPAEDPDEVAPDEVTPTEVNSGLIGNFSEMVSEVKTLIRVINESSESKENFEMLFRLIVQKYQVLCGTPYHRQINDFLMSEGAPEFPFSLTETDLENYWTPEN